MLKGARRVHSCFHAHAIAQSNITINIHESAFHQHHHLYTLHHGGNSILYAIRDCLNLWCARLKPVLPTQTIISANMGGGCMFIVQHHQTLLTFGTLDLKVYMNLFGIFTRIYLPFYVFPLVLGTTWTRRVSIVTMNCGRPSKGSS